MITINSTTAATTTYIDEVETHDNNSNHEMCYPNSL